MLFLHLWNGIFARWALLASYLGVKNSESNSCLERCRLWISPKKATNIDSNVPFKELVDDLERKWKEENGPVSRTSNAKAENYALTFAS